MVAITDSVGPDSALAAFALPYHRSTQAALDRPLGRLEHAAGAPRGRFADGPLWELIQRAQLAASGADVSLATLADPEAVIDSGQVTMRDALRACPCDNTLAMIELTGDQLKRTLERSARYFALYTYAPGRPLTDPDIPGFDFDAAEGVTYNENYSQRSYTTGLPVFPSIGIEYIP